MIIVPWLIAINGPLFIVIAIISTGVSETSNFGPGWAINTLPVIVYSFRPAVEE